MSRDTAIESQHDVVNVQEQLLEMLRMAGNEVPPPRRQTSEAVVVSASPMTAEKAANTKTCQKCGSEKPWGTSSWCPDCGYYPKAGFGGTGVVEYADETPPDLRSIFPPWAIPMGIGMFVILVVSIGSQFVYKDPLQRSLLALYQLGFFVFCAMVAHFRASFLVIQEGRTLMAIVNPTETWSAMLQRVPATQWLILIFAWGLTGTMTSFFIGLDIDVIAEEVAKEVKKNPKVTFADVASAMTKVTKSAFQSKEAAGILAKVMQVADKELGGIDPANAEGALLDLVAATEGISSVASGGGSSGSGDDRYAPGGSADKTTNATTESPQALPTAAPAKPTFDYWIYGYTTNPEGEIRSLLLATTGGTGPLRFVQKLGLDGLSSEQLAMMSEQLKPYRVRNAAIASPYGGKWVKPVAKCRVEHEGLNADSRPTNAKFQSVVLP